LEFLAGTTGRHHTLNLFIYTRPIDAGFCTSPSLDDHCGFLALSSAGVILGQLFYFLIVELLLE
jgi:hypothetical protein